MHTLSELRSGQLAGASKLTLSANLTEFPMEILSLADSLEVLDLSNNRLTSLPDEIQQLTKLRILFASNNPFETLPESLGKCPNLEIVGFKANQIKHVPEGALPKKLRWLILTDNQITALPQSLGERHLMQKLMLAGNQLAELPSNLSQLTNLELVRISANKLTSFPEQLLSLPKLAWVAFSGNPFSHVNYQALTVPQVSLSSIQVQNVLGQGASGVISKAQWQAPQVELPEHIAVKVFKGEVTSDGYPKDEMQACLKVGAHPNLVRPLAQVAEDDCLALVMALIPKHYRNLGLPPSFDTCTRDTFKEGESLSIAHIEKIVAQMQSVFAHLHSKQVCHGDLYAHNTLIDDEGNMIFGDFGAASMYHMLNQKQQAQIVEIERRALGYFIEDLLSICAKEDRDSAGFAKLKKIISN
ncbi:leucine-rich repeat-containing protein kinase family protein [Paraglaciecola sp. 2405UD69-4]|uniref:leucine-rich repeat-containing protein kinase family protein n=1 Tax=Paraglaciecola sp. 2405UD69-4 TaxID=3391836 RepID=UPI0039C915C6